MVPGPVPSGEVTVSQLCSGRHGAVEGVRLIAVIADWLCRVLEGTASRVKRLRKAVLAPFL